MANNKDFPFLEVAETADQAVRNGGTIYQKWSCDGCGARITGSKPNLFTKSGKCDHCGTITDIVKKGCDYLLLMPLSEASKLGLTTPPQGATKTTRH